MPLGRLAAWSAWEEVDYAMFARESDLNHVNNIFRTKLHFYLRDLIFQVEGRQLSFRDRPNTEVDFRFRRTATRGKLGLSYMPISRSRVDLFLTREDFRYDPGRPEISDDTDPNTVREIGENLSTALERVEGVFGMEGRLRILPRTTLLLDAGTSRIDFDSGPADNFPQRDSDSVSAMVGLELDPSGPLRGSLKVGKRHLRPDADDIDGFSDWIADSDMSLRIAGRGYMRTNYYRNIAFSIFGENLFHTLERRGLSYQHHFTGRLSVEAGRQLDDIDYPLPFNVGTASIPVMRHRHDDVRADTVTFRYRLGPSLLVGLAVGRWWRDSSFDENDTSRTTITTLMRYTP